MFRKYLNYYAPVLSFQKNGDGLGDFSGDQDRRICLYGAWQEPSYCTCGGQQKGRQGHTFYLTRLKGERLMPCLQDPHVVELVSLLIQSQEPHIQRPLPELTHWTLGSHASVSGGKIRAIALDA